MHLLQHEYYCHYLKHVIALKRLIKGAGTLLGSPKSHSEASDFMRFGATKGISY